MRASIPTIGLFINEMSGMTDYQECIWHGIYDYTKENGINLICFPGDNLYMDSDKKLTNPRNSIYEIASEKILDGILIATTTMSNFVSAEDYAYFLRRFNKLPLVSIGKAPIDIPMVVVDNKAGLKKVIIHLIEEHNKRKLAFITGPLDNPDALERFEAYKEVLIHYGMEFDERYVFKGTFLVESGAKAVDYFIKEEKIEFDAIVASNDQMAFGAMEALKNYGIKVPLDIAVTGFDDSLLSRYSNPSLTTVMQPVYMQSMSACEMLINIIERNKAGELKVLETELIIRQSCGCVSEELKEIKSRTELIITQPVPSDKKSYLISKLKRFNLEEEFLENLLSSIFNELKSRADRFAYDFNVLLSGLLSRGKNLGELSNLLSTLRNELFTIFPDETDYIEVLIHKSRVILTEILLRRQAQKELEISNVNASLRSALFSLSGNFELKDFLENFKNALNDLRLPYGYILLNDNEKLIYLFGYSITKGVIKSSEEFIESELLLPHNVWPDKNFHLIVYPILFKQELLGRLILHIGETYSFVYESLFGQVSSSIKGAMLFEKSRRIESELIEKNKKLEDLVMPMLKTIEEISIVLKEREKTLGELNEATRESYEKLSKTNEIIEVISNYTNKMVEIINIIDDISMTVNLVALNASIESTHAGEYGKGFAIIAKEIKKLSDSTKKNAGEIAETLKNVVRNIKESMAAGQETLKIFKDQEKLILQLLESLTSTSEGIKKLSLASKEILGIMRTN